MAIRFLLALAVVFSINTWAQIEVYEDGSTAQPETGKKAATEYFLKRKRARKSEPAPRESRYVKRDVAASGDRYLMLNLGLFFDQESYRWGESNQDDIADFTAGVTYRVGEWVSSMDMNFRADMISYSLDEGNALKLSMMPVITFPDARSEFPMYFGAGAGLGVFFRQIEDESHLSFDYTVLAGVRLMNLVDNMGFTAEVGMKNHIFLLSDGQFNGAYFSIGTVFDF